MNKFYPKQTSTVLVNRTAHKVVDVDGNVDLMPAISDDVIRVAPKYIKVKEIMGSPISILSPKLSHQLPQYNPAVCYVVSKKVAEAIYTLFPNRKDFVYPGIVVHDTVIKDGKEQLVLVGCRGFVTLYQD